MIWFWRLMIGYLKIKISGQNGEKILNISASNGINIWNLCYKNGCIYGNISIKNFNKLRKVKRGIKSKISIEKKYGIYFKLKKYKNRAGFHLGIIIFFILIHILSNYVWIINVNGNDLIQEKNIIATCKKIGISTGIKKEKINSKYDAQRLQLNMDNIAWCGLNLEGCVLTVDISETTASDKADRANPSNLKASIEGKIKKIDVTSGNVNVKIGDFVSKGDLLVSGVNNNLKSTNFVHSEGTIIAETKREFSADGKFVEEINIPTEENINRYTIQFFNLKIPIFLGNIKKEHNYVCNNYTLKLFNKKIPINVCKEEYCLTKKTKIRYDEQDLENKLYENINEQLNNYNFINVTETNKEILKTQDGILLKITYICEENIAVQDKILFNNVN